MTDVVTFGETMLRLSPPSGERIETADSLECRTAGAESNVAVAAARLGADTVWLSKLPDSVLGRRVAGDIRSHGVDTRVAWSDQGRQGTYYIEQGGRPRGSNVLYDRAGAAVTTATLDDLDTGVVPDGEVFFTTGITPALSETLYETTETLLAESETAGFDLNYRSKLWSPAEAREAYDVLLPSVDLLFAPERDARSILDISGEPTDMVETLQSRYGCETVVLTRGRDGAVAGSASETSAISPAIVRLSAAVADPQRSASSVDASRTYRERYAPTNASPVPIGSTVSASKAGCSRVSEADPATAPSLPRVRTTVSQP